MMTHILKYHMHLSTSTLWVLSATSLCYQLLSRYIVRCSFCTWNKKHLLISSAMEHSLPVQARLAERSSWCCQALKLKASLARDCSGKHYKADGLVKRETHGRLCMTSAPCYLILLPELSCKKPSGRKDVSHVHVLCLIVHFALVNTITSLYIQHHYFFSNNLRGPAGTKQLMSRSDNSC